MRHRNAKTLQVSLELLVGWLRGDLPPTKGVENAPPPDTRIRDARYNGFNGVLDLMIESDSFPENAEGEVIPPFGATWYEGWTRDWRPFYQVIERAVGEPLLDARWSTDEDRPPCYEILFGDYARPESLRVFRGDTPEAAAERVLIEIAPRLPLK